jgi:RES domain
MTDRHHSPPTDFNQIALPIVEFGGSFYRLNSQQDKDKTRYYPSAQYFDCSGDGRWDSPSQGYGILYTGIDIRAAFVESLGRKPEQRKRLMPTEDLNGRFLAKFTSKRPLRFVKVYGYGLQCLGADARLTTTTDYGVSREWGRAFHEHPDNVDGICYLSRHDNTKQCYGIFDRVVSEISESQLCDGEFQLVDPNHSLDPQYRGLALPNNRIHPDVKLDEVLAVYSYIESIDRPVTGIESGDITT